MGLTLFRLLIHRSFFLSPPPPLQGNVVLNVITEFCSEFRTVIDGGSNDLNVNELSGGARISFVYHELFNNGVKSIDPFDQVKDGDIRTILYNSSVRSRRGFSRPEIAPRSRRRLTRCSRFGWGFVRVRLRRCLSERPRLR